MPRRVKDWLEGFLEYSDNSEPPSIYRQWVGLSVLASALQRKCWLELGVEVFYPNLFVVLVGPPAARKGTAIRYGTNILSKLGITTAADESSKQKLIARLANSYQQDTYNGEVIIHSSLTIISTELTVFLGFQDLDLLSDLCKWYDCESRFLYDTHSRGEEEAVNVWVNLLGATTPMLLQTALPEGAIGSGFTSRTIFVYAGNKEKVVLIPILSEKAKVLQKLLEEDLEEIHGLAGRFTPTKDALDLYKAWRIRSEQSAEFRDTKLEFYDQRRPGHVLKLSLLSSASRGNSYTIEKEDMARALDIIHATEENMQKVFQGVGTNRLAAIQIRVQRMLEVNKTIPIQDVWNAFYSDATNTELGDILASLEARRLCRIDAKRGIIIAQ